MDRQTALDTFGLEDTATTDEVEARFGELYNDLQLRITNAPTPALKALYQRNLEELKEAKRVLSGAQRALHNDLPLSQPHYVLGGEEVATEIPDWRTQETKRNPVPSLSNAIPRWAYVLISLLALGCIALGVLLFRGAVEVAHNKDGPASGTEPIVSDSSQGSSQQIDSLAGSVRKPMAPVASPALESSGSDGPQGGAKTSAGGMTSVAGTKSTKEDVLRKALAKLERDMVFVEGGTFTMGCTDLGAGDFARTFKAHPVELSSFYICRYEVTVALWKAVMDSARMEACNDCPYTATSWEIGEFLTELKRLTGIDYRLPTEAEWEYAARGGQQSKGYVFPGACTFSFKENGDQRSERDLERICGAELDRIAWHEGNSGGSLHPVGMKAPNELGLYDMAGNAGERCFDPYSKSYYMNSPLRNPQGPTEGYYDVMRGGTHKTSYVQAYLVYYRDIADGSSRFPGFRLARSY